MHDNATSDQVGLLEIAAPDASLDDESLGLVFFGLTLQ